MLKLKLHWQIAIAIALALVAGVATGMLPEDAPARAYATGVYDFFGDIFKNALKMIIVPLITSSIIVGVAGMGKGTAIGRLGARTVLFYATTSLAAILVGLVLVNIFQPGIYNGEPAKQLLALEASTADVEQRVGGRDAGDIIEIFVRMVPPNVISAAANGEMLGLIFFSLLFGYFMTRLDDAYAGTLFRFWEAVFEVMMGITDLVMRFAPIGVFGLIAGVIASLDFSEVRDFITILSKYALIVAFALVIHTFLTLPLFLRYIARVRSRAMFSGMAPALLTAFSTASSSATLPVTMECVEDNIGVSKKVASFVLPLGATVNMNGTALYECVAAMFIAQAYGLEITLGVQFIIVLTALVTSIGVAGVPQASLVAIAIILQTIGLPLEAIGVLFVFDRILDMARTAVNVFGDACCATIVARLEGEETSIPLNPGHAGPAGHRG
ncbi:MAG: dicarboxylate/amino acid:cation symporter [Gammaproteobacteria bacterium]